MRVKLGIAAGLVLAAICMSSAAFAVLYQDDFEGYLPGELPASWSVVQGAWEILDGTLFYDPWNQGTPPGKMRYNEGYGWTDYSVTATLLITDGDAYIGGRINSVGAGYYVRRLISDQYGSKLELRGTGIGGLGVADFPNDWQAHDITLSFEGSSIKVFVDGGATPVISATNSVYTGGTIGVTVGGGYFIGYDDVVVTGDPVPEPSGIVAFAGSLLGLAGMLRRRIIAG